MAAKPSKPKLEPPPKPERPIVLNGKAIDEITQALRQDVENLKQERRKLDIRIIATEERLKSFTVVAQAIRQWEAEDREIETPSG